MKYLKKIANYDVNVLRLKLEDIIKKYREQYYKAQKNNFDGMKKWKIKNLYSTLSWEIVNFKKEFKDNYTNEELDELIDDSGITKFLHFLL